MIFIPCRVHSCVSAKVTIMHKVHFNDVLVEMLMLFEFVGDACLIAGSFHHPMDGMLHVVS